MPRNPRHHLTSTATSTFGKRKMIRYRQHSPFSSTQVIRLNRTFTRKSRYLLTLSITVTPDQVLVSGVKTANFQANSVSPNKGELVQLSTTLVSGPNIPALNAPVSSSLLYVSMSGLIPGIYTFLVSGVGIVSRASGQIVTRIIAS